MSTTKVFLSLDLDLDGIPQSQTAIDSSGMALEVCAAPAGVSYITCGSGDNVGVESLPISDLAAANLDLTGKTITVTDLVVKASDFVVNSCPIPLPFGYIQLDADDVLSSDEKKLGYSNTPTSIVSNTDDITWDDTNKYFVCAKAGTYEVMAVVILEGGSSLVNLSVQRNGSDMLVGAPRVHSSVDPLEHTIRAIFTMTAGQNTGITYEATGAATVKATTGSTASVSRKK